MIRRIALFFCEIRGKNVNNVFRDGIFGYGYVEGLRGNTVEVGRLGIRDSFGFYYGNLFWEIFREGIEVERMYSVVLKVKVR